MSFSGEQKELILKQPPKNFCCRRAMLYAMLAAKADTEGDTLTLRTDTRRTAAFVSLLVQELFSRETAVLPPPRGGRGALCVFESTTAARYLSLLPEKGFSPTVKCTSCIASAFQGIFLVAGNVSDPARQYRLEFTLGDRIPAILPFFSVHGMAPKEAVRGGERLLYMRNSETVEDFFATAGMNATAFLIMNSKINNEFRNNANRVANCETNNIGKAVSASQRSLSVLERLDRQGLLSSLPEELERTARLRLRNPHLSLSQLGALSVPPLSKPGISHRMERIIAAGMELLGDLPEDGRKEK